MSTNEILATIAFASLLVERAFAHAKMRTRSEQWVRDAFAGLVKTFNDRLDQAEARHRKCEEDLAELRETISVITPEPAE